MKVFGIFVFSLMLFFCKLTQASDDLHKNNKNKAELGNAKSDNLYSAENFQLVLEEKVFLNVFEKIKDQNLENSRAWQKLIHRERNVLGFKVVQITDERFFLSNTVRKINKYKNLNELEITLLAFFQDPSRIENQIDDPASKNKGIEKKIIDHSQHGICRFPARLKFLKKHVKSEIWDKLPSVNCTYQKLYLDALDYKSVSFVFSSYYADSPGSAFGHTLFRVNRSEGNANLRQELLDYGIGYAADVTTNNGLLYALLGLTGGFTGSWANLPYYYKVREYNDFESRDLWSYDLNLTQDELDMLMLHFWEIGSHLYTYYFFTQNCAYHMLTALEAAAPRLHLIDHVPFLYVIPVDSMKALFFNEGLVKNVSFRPSLRRVFIERTKKIEITSKKALQNFIDKNDLEIFNSISDLKEKANTIDAAIDLMQMRYPEFKETDKKADRDTAKLKSELLGLRAKINLISEEVSPKMDLKNEPSKSHGSAKTGITYFEKNNVKQGFFNYRFALHDMLDPTQGLPENSQLEFFSLKFQLKPADLKFYEGDFFRLFNLNPINFFEKKLSWAVNFGVQNKQKYCDENEYACYLYGFQGKFGYSFNSKGIYETDYGTLFWLMGTVNARHANNLKNNKKIYFAPGFEAGALHRFNQNQAVMASFMREYPSDFENDTSYQIQYRIALKNMTALSLIYVDDSFGLDLSYYY